MYVDCLRIDFDDIRSLEGVRGFMSTSVHSYAKSCDQPTFLRCEEDDSGVGDAFGEDAPEESWLKGCKDSFSEKLTWFLELTEAYSRGGVGGLGICVSRNTNGAEKDSTMSQG